MQTIEATIFRRRQHKPGTSDIEVAHKAPPLALNPGVSKAALALVAKTVVSAVQGVISLELDEKLTPTPVEALHRQVRLLVRAIAPGLPASLDHSAGQQDGIAAATRKIMC